MELQLRVVVELRQVFVLSFMLDLPWIAGAAGWAVASAFTHRAMPRKYTESIHLAVRKARICGLLTLSLMQKTFPRQEIPSDTVERADQKRIMPTPALTSLFKEQC